MRNFAGYSIIVVNVMLWCRARMRAQERKITVYKGGILYGRWKQQLGEDPAGRERYRTADCPERVQCFYDESTSDSGIYGKKSGRSGGHPG